MYLKHVDLPTLVTFQCVPLLLHSFGTQHFCQHCPPEIIPNLPFLLNYFFPLECIFEIVDSDWPSWIASWSPFRHPALTFLLQVWARGPCGCGAKATKLHQASTEGDCSREGGRWEDAGALPGGNPRVESSLFSDCGWTEVRGGRDAVWGRWSPS